MMHPLMRGLATKLPSYHVDSLTFTAHEIATSDPMIVLHKNATCTVLYFPGQAAE